MAAPLKQQGADRQESKVQKLSRLPKGVKLEKRPLLHPAIPSPYAGSSTQKVVYVSSRTPFSSALSRVERLLSHVAKRQSQSDLSRRKRKRGQHVPISTSTDSNVEEVLIKATGKAIDKALQLALVLQQQSDLCVQIKTGSVAAIDDIVQNEAEPAEDTEELPESRIRHTSVIEIEVKLST